MNEQKILEYYNILKHLKMASVFVEEITMCNKLILNFNENDAIILLNQVIPKYSKQLNEIDVLYSNVKVIENQKGIYMNKTQAEENADLIYLRNCIVLIGCVSVGIEKNLKTILTKI